MIDQYPFQPVSAWLKAPADLRHSLAKDTRADVAIIGGGYTGLSAALSLRKQGADVVLLEQGFAGSGASGRNAGHVTPTIGKDLPSLLRFFGEERASKLVRFADEAVEYVDHLIDELGIECDYVRNGNIMAAVHPKHAARLRAAAEAGGRLGGEVTFLSDGEMRERGLPPAFHCGVLERRGGVLQPGLYVSGLRKAALAAGVRLYEGTKVSRLEAAAPARVRCEGGTVTADAIVVATNAYTARLGYRKRAVAPIRVSLFETDPLTDEHLEAIDWRGREGIYTSHEALESYRLTARRTIVGGSKVVRYAFGSALPPGRDKGAFDAISRAFHERFPPLAEVAVENFWGGWIGFTLDFLPTIGTTGDHKNVHHGFGFAGHGLAQATLMGAMLAERVVGRAHAAEAALDRRFWNLPPEPFRWLFVNAINRALMLVDAQTDRQIRQLPRAPRELAAGRTGPVHS